MTRNLLTTLVLLPVLALTACPAQQQGSAPESAAAPALETEEQKTLYAFGFMIAQRAQELDLNADQQQAFLEGSKTALAGEEPPFDVAAYQQQIAAFVQQRVSVAAEEEKLASQEFVDAAATEPGAVRTDSGLVFIETAAGSDQRPKATDTVRVHYHGTMRDGSVFDSSVERGTPAVFPLNRVVPCWTEALQRVGVGGKATIVCPSSIAYGDRGAPPRIPPGAALKFEVELLEIVTE